MPAIASISNECKRKERKLYVLKASNWVNSMNFKEFGHAVGKLTVVFITSSANVMDMWEKIRGKKDCF